MEAATEKNVRVRVFEGHTQEVFRVVMPRDGSFALTSSPEENVRRWELDADSARHTIVSENGDIGLALTANGSYAAAGDEKGNIRLIALPSNREIKAWHAHLERAGNLAFVAGGSELLSAGMDGLVQRWNARTGELLAHWKLPFDNLFGVAGSADGSRIVAAAFGEGLAVLSPQGVQILSENVGSQSPVSLTADGQFVFTGTEDGKVERWEALSAQRVAVFEGHRGNVSAVAVTPDGRFCVSAGADQTVRLWAAQTGECLAILRGHSKRINGVAVTPDARRIASVSNDLTLRVWDIPDSILARAATSRKRGYMNAKVVLLGDSGVGKSGLALRLWHDKWEKTESSHGMEIQRLVLPQEDADPDVVREVWLWDLAGQPDYRLTHQLFMEQTSVALLVFDPQDPNVFDTVGYWQNALRKVVRGGEVKGVLVAARCDRPGLRLTMEEIERWAKARGLDGPILTAAKLKKHAGAGELRDLIAKLLPWESIEFRSTMENFPALKDAILSVRDTTGRGGVVVTPAELEARVRKAAPKLAFTPEDLRAVTGLLAGEGVLYALPYGDLVVLQPSWVNSYASTLVKLAGEDEGHLGHVPLATIQPGQLPADGTPRLSVDDERQLLPALVALFLQRALAWKQDTDKGAMLVFPNYVRLPRPEPPPRPGRTVLYRFAGPLEEIYCTLVVRLHYSGLFAETKLYRQAADFQTATGRLAALTMSEHGERGELEIYFGADLDPDVQASFQRFVHDHLKAKATGLERLRNFFCPKCHEEVTDRRAIDAALQKNRSEIVCVYCDPKNPGIILLNDVLERQFASNAGEAGADRAARKANEEISAASKEGVMVGEVQAIVFSADQIYRIIAEPDEGIDGEIEFRGGARRRAAGLGYRVQLKSGDSHLRKLKNGTEKFAMKEHYEDLWAGKGKVPVLLIIRSGDGRLRYMDATEAIIAAQKANPGKPVTQLVFDGEDFTKEAVLRLREKRLSS
jgi:WD40 repeat protein